MRNQTKDNKITKTLILGFLPILPSTEPRPAAADVAGLFKLWQRHNVLIVF